MRVILYLDSLNLTYPMLPLKEVAMYSILGASVVFNVLFGWCGMLHSYVIVGAVYDENVIVLYCVCCSCFALLQ